MTSWRSMLWKHDFQSPSSTQTENIILNKRSLVHTSSQLYAEIFKQPSYANSFLENIFIKQHLSSTWFWFWQGSFKEIDCPEVTNVWCLFLNWNLGKREEYSMPVLGCKHTNAKQNSTRLLSFLWQTLMYADPSKSLGIWTSKGQ